jgi:hypothetical protein
MANNSAQPMAGAHWRAHLALRRKAFITLEIHRAQSRTMVLCGDNFGAGPARESLAPFVARFEPDELDALIEKLIEARDTLPVPA